MLKTYAAFIVIVIGRRKKLNYSFDGPKILFVCFIFLGKTRQLNLLGQEKTL